MISGSRIQQARELRGLTQGELAARVGISQAAIHYLESGRSQPSRDIFERIALQTGFPLAFFRQEESPNFPEGSLLYRARRKTKTSVLSAAYCYAKTIFELASRMAERVSQIPVRVPQLNAKPSEAARITRSVLGLSRDAPIPNLLRSVEKAGVLVIVLPLELEQDGIDAFSVWAGPENDRPVIVVSSKVPGDRQRFTVAHELGHLVLHQAPKGRTSEIEQEANEFAAELLLPETGVRRDLSPPVTLASLAPLKLRWGVSIQMLIMRAKDLRIITPTQHKYLYQELSARGWRTREPVNLDIPVERPRVITKMAEVIYGEIVDCERLARDSYLVPGMVRQILQAHGAAFDDDHPGSGEKIVSLTGKQGHKS